jgi:hypothetical protein
MGSSYEVLKTDVSSIELHEMSCLFSIELDPDTIRDDIGAIHNLTPDQIGEMAVKMIHAASYFVEDSQAFMDKYADLARKY